MKFILIFTLFISTYSIAASSHANDSIWEGWSTTEIASLLRRTMPCVDAVSSALRYNYKSDHETSIKKALEHLHQQNTKIVESCAQALYETLLLQEQAKASKTTPPSSYQPLPSFKKSDLFKAGKLHPSLSRFIKQHGNKDTHKWNPKLNHLRNYFKVGFTPNANGEIIEVELPLYIIKKNDCQLTQTHISKRDANTLISTDSTLAFVKDALQTTETGAIFIYAKITLQPLLRLLNGTCSFSAYETKPSPLSRLKARPKDIQFSKEIEQACADLAKISKKEISRPPSRTPEPTTDVTRPELPTGILITFC